MFALNSNVSTKFIFLTFPFSANFLNNSIMIKTDVHFQKLLIANKNIFQNEHHTHTQGLSESESAL